MGKGTDTSELVAERSKGKPMVEVDVELGIDEGEHDLLDVAQAGGWPAVWHMGLHLHLGFYVDVDAEEDVLAAVWARGRARSDPHCGRRLLWLAPPIFSLVSPHLPLISPSLPSRLSSCVF
ncbi:uncharacterized protein A4U43_C03F14370 [Asparagus officinalis]|uniref:Uncharacterized protein n=1 Tax=Asparagus officinalis TaxID=4686 RepID=A0A5P1FCT8_ASPOF|nr:uncharacterized protein A4U43_C03F14370 [Asparagus officinalis]